LLKLTLFGLFNKIFIIINVRILTWAQNLIIQRGSKEQFWISKRFLLMEWFFWLYVVNFRLLKIFKEKFQSFSLKIKFFYTKGPFCTTFVSMKFLICLVKFRVCVVKKSKNLNFSKIFQNFENGYSAFKYPWGVVQYGMGFVFVHSTLNYLGNFRSVFGEILV